MRLFVGAALRGVAETALRIGFALLIGLLQLRRTLSAGGFASLQRRASLDRGVNAIARLRFTKGRACCGLDRAQFVFVLAPVLFQAIQTRRSGEGVAAIMVTLRPLPAQFGAAHGLSVQFGERLGLNLLFGSGDRGSCRVRVRASEPRRAQQQ